MNKELKTTVDPIVLHADQPATGRDDAPDLLNRYPFAQRISEAILALPHNTGLVISVEGPFGSGKTSVLNFVSTVLENAPLENRPILSKFGPWTIGSAETLIRTFLVQLASVVGLTPHAKHAADVAKQLINYSSVFSVLRLVPGAEPWAGIVKDLFESVGTATDQIREVKKLDLEAQRTKVVNALRKLNRRIVVFIDDLDRLVPDEIIEMIRLVKAVGDFPGVTYILCFERSNLVASLEKANLANANAFLDKIIQVRLTLPLVSRDDLAEILNHEIESLPYAATKDYFPGLQQRHQELYYFGLRTLLENPRDIKLLFNRIRFVEPGCRGEVNLADLIALEALSIKAPGVYAHIKENPAAYVGQELGGAFTLRKTEEVIASCVEERIQALASAPTLLRPQIESLLDQLFPQLRKNTGGFTGEYASVRGLVAAPDRLAVALSAGLPRGEVSYQSAINFLVNPDRREGIIGEALNISIKRFFDHLNLAIRSTSVVNPEGFIYCIGKALDTSIASELDKAQSHILDMGVSRPAWWLAEACLRQLKEEHRKQVLEWILSNTEILSIAASAIVFLRSQLHKDANDANTSGEKPWISPEELTKLTDIWLETANSVISNGRVYSATNSGRIFNILENLCPDEFTKFVQSTIASDHDLDRFMLAVGHTGSDSIGGRFVQFDADDLAKLGGAECLKKRAGERLADQSVVGVLRHVYAAITSGRKTYLNDGAHGLD